MFAFEITEDDVWVVLENNKAILPSGKSYCELASDLMDSIDFNKVEAAALNGDDINSQTEYSHEEILNQLKSSGKVQFA